MSSRIDHFGFDRRTVASGSAALAFLLLFLTIPQSCFASAPSAPLPFEFRTTSAPFLNQGWDLADFDGDHQPDLATAEREKHTSQNYVYRVALRLSAHAEGSSFRISTKYSVLSLASRDVDGDHDQDLVITDAVSHQRIGVWINDGQGGFTEADQSLYPASVWLDERFIAPDGTSAADPAFLQPSRRSWFTPARSHCFALDLKVQGDNDRVAGRAAPCADLDRRQTRAPPAHSSQFLTT